MADAVFDLAVIGFGAAGSAAALTAARAGGRVALIEKQPAGAHYSNTRFSGGLIATVADVERALPYVERCAGGMIPTPVLRAWAERAASLPEWLLGVGLRTQRIAGGWYPQAGDADAIGVVSIVKGDPADDGTGFQGAAEAGALPKNLMDTGLYANGRDLADALEAAVRAEPGITILHDHAARRLLRSDRRVAGVLATASGEEIEIRATHGVVLACGGFEFDEQLKRDFLRAQPLHFYGTPANTGDGLRMAQEAGAALWHMGQIVGKAVAHVELEGRPLNFNITLDPPGYVLLDGHGRRFANEDARAGAGQQLYHELIRFDAGRLEYPRIPAYWIFDRRRMAAGPIANKDVGLVGSGLYPWSPDNHVELERGWIVEGSNVEEVAARAGLSDPTEAARSVEAYNAACRAGADPLGRPAESLVPLEPPFFCMPLFPGGACTCGGPRRDEKARILDAFGDPIPGLFGAGELGEIVGLAAPSGGANLSDALCFGQIAAETALAR
jgi:succinate dehydrogenase/fumarate reductase flavoprotein subunit